MNIEQTAVILAKVAALDNRNDTDAAVLAWHEAIGDLDYRDALEAVAIHRRESTEYLMPAHIRRIAAQLRKERGDRNAKDERAAEIQEFVRDVRDTLPEGNVTALHPRREQWRREHRDFQRQATAEPNPLWDPTMGPASTWERSKLPPQGAWWENDAAREADSRKILHLAGRLKRRRQGDAEEAS